MESSSSSSHYDVGNQTDDALIVSGGIVIGWLLSIVTVLGNGLVIFALTTEKSLRSNPANLFILNLSIVDFLTGAFSFPLNTLWLMFDYWPFGEGVCKMWLIIDYTACAVSVCGIILISLDRYWMLKLKLKYRQFQTTTRVTVMILVSWAAVLPYYAIPILFWEKFSGEQIIDYSEDCEMESEESLAYNLATAVFVKLLIPLTIILYLNINVYNEIRHRARINHNQSILQVADNNLSISAGRSTSDSGRQNVNTKISSARRHRKSAVTLAALVSTFVVCWTPYSIVLIWSIIDDAPNHMLLEVVNYLLWGNSAINPFLYALTNPKIREVFLKFLGLKCFNVTSGTCHWFY
ncbi:histamine H3 receptor-like [Antedon mediterranea]|uniref:histamine H3 receptor-like n=1 Tax=Antedon mediterranea TaxID=105859 RepID=UPI003AF793C7